MSIELKNITKCFNNFVAIKDVNLVVNSGELVAFLGPSGSGKSTILRIIAGLETADTGEINFYGERANHLHTREREVGFVFQHYALFRHMTVEQNIAFGLKVRKVPRQRQITRINELLNLMGLTGFGQRYPHQLSGGQRQRVALARALAPEPKLLLLDEPFGAVDAKVREELRHWLRRLHDEVQVTSIFVTHDQEEAFAVADKVMIINHGKIEQVGTPIEILDSPATEFVAHFIGEANIYQSIIKKQQAQIGKLTISASNFADYTPVSVVLRFYDLKFWRDDVNGIATVVRIVPLGDRVKVEAALDDVGSIFSQFPRRSSLLHGIELGCRIQIEVTLARVYSRA